MRPSYLILAVCLATAFSAEAWKPAMSANQIYGQNRIIILCNGIWQAEMINRDDFVERDIALVEFNNGIAESVTKSRFGDIFRHPVENSEALMRRAACGADREYVLIGKDTGVKQRWSKILPQDALLLTIDAMPMRQYEMRTRGGK